MDPQTVALITTAVALPLLGAAGYGVKWAWDEFRKWKEWRAGVDADAAALARTDRKEGEKSLVAHLETYVATLSDDLKDAEAEIQKLWDHVRRLEIRQERYRSRAEYLEGLLDANNVKYRPFDPAPLDQPPGG